MNYVMKTSCIFLWLLLMACVPMAGADREIASLVLSNEQGKRMACLPLQPGEPIDLDFINSIYQAPVRETFIYVPGEGLVLTQVASPSAGVFEYYGLEWDGSGISQMRRRVGEIRILSSDYENHSIRVGGKNISLKQLVKDGEPVLMKVEEGNCGRSTG